MKSKTRPRLRYAWLGFLILLGTPAPAQQHAEQNHAQYVVPRDSLVRQKLAGWQDIKFGLLMHWGTYSEWGIVESWSLCPEDEPWCERRGPYAANWYDYKRAYEKLQTTFNPTRFNPDRWAAAARAAGMKYVVFTTKHHDGFCLFDTKQTDYKITSPKSPFSTNPRSNVAKEVFDAFRKQDFLIGAYFSKPDWNTPHYWDPYFPPKDRNASYAPQKYPERWDRFKTFTYNQIEELMTGYGKIDILWLDGGWVRPRHTIDSSISWQRTIPYEQDIDLPRIAAMARRHQPGLLVVDRTVTGEFENYVTPEQSIPGTYLPIPWESCLTLGDSWSYLPKENFKSARWVVQTLVDIVAKNGNLLLNVAPGPDGEWHPEAYERLEAVGAWLRTHGEAIYGTKPVAPYRQDQWAFTGTDRAQYRTYLPKAGEAAPTELLLPGAAPARGTVVTLLGYDKPLKMRETAAGFVVLLPEAARRVLGTQPAWVFKQTGFPVPSR